MDERPSRCAECADLLAHDQRYCLHCGARRGPLPARIGLTVGEIHQRGRALPATGAELSTPAVAAGDDPRGADRLVPAARSAAVAILLMIAFGCVVGSLTTPGGVEALARQLVVAVTPPPSAPVRSAATASTGGRDTGSSGNTGGAAPASSPATAASPAAVPQQTITVGSPATSTSATTPSGTTTPANILGLPPIKHVWEIVLSEQGYDQAFAARAGHPYLATRLRRQGKLITGYYGVAQSPLANEIALISGQGPTPQTLAGCPTFSDIAPATIGRFAQVTGAGCVYPESTLTLPDQLSRAGLRWRAYVEGIGRPASSQTTSSTTSTTSTVPPVVPPATSTTTTTTGSATDSPAVPPTRTCPHPPLNGPDAQQSASAAEPYVTWRNPFVYFRSVLIGGHCASGDVGLGRLAVDLKQVSTTPAFSYLSPGPCDDGSDQPCSANAPAGLSQADRFLKAVVPRIERSAAYKQDGLIVITFDGVPPTGPHADLTSCCDQPQFPNLPPPATTGSSTSTSTLASTAPASTTAPTTTVAPTTTGSGTTTATTTTATTTTSTTTPLPGTNPGGGQVGLLLISRYVTPNSVDAVSTFNHFSLLKSIEDLFGLRPLGYARDSALPVFDAAIFKAAKH
jgi:hypothetical protein